MTEFLSGRPGAVLLTAVLFMFILGLQAGGYTIPGAAHYVDGLFAALMLSLNAGRASAPAKPEEPAK